MAVFQLKRATAARWEELNPVLANGDPGFEYDNNRLKIGNGITSWLDLPYIEGANEIISVNTYEELPIIGNSKYLYKVNSTKTIYQWNSLNSEYESMSSSGSFDPNQITLINGGKANG